jgi:hypothetical protein
LRSAIDARRKALNITLLELDDLALLASGHASKLTCGTKNYGEVSLAAVLGALGAVLILVPAEEAEKITRDPPIGSFAV